MNDGDLRIGATNYAYSGFEDMLLDEDRNHKYRTAIESVIQQKLRKNDYAHVLDIGSGTGLLSLYAAKAGATSITSIELDPVIFKVSKAIAKRNGFADKITFINAESIELDSLPQKANILISEIFDSELLGENVLRTFQHALRTLTTPDVICIPFRSDIFVVPIESRLLAQQCRLPDCFDASCEGNLTGIDAHYSTSGKKTYEYACQPSLLKSFEFNNVDSLELKDTIRLEFRVEEAVNRIDGVLLWWDLDLMGDGKLIITTGIEKDKPRWRNHWLQVAYGFPQHLPVNLNDKFNLIGSHDAVSFSFGLKEGNRNCTCSWHQNVPSSALLRWNTVYQKSNFVEIAVKESIGKNVVCIGSFSLLPMILNANRLIVVDGNRRFCDQMERICRKNVQFVREISQIYCWDKIDIIIFDVHSDPTEIVPLYRSIADSHKEIKVIPEKIELNVISVKFLNLWRRKIRIKQVDEFDYTDFDECFGKMKNVRHDELELLPLWEEICYTKDNPIKLLDLSRNDNPDLREILIPKDSDAFVFFFEYIHDNTTIYQPFKRLSEEEIEWDKGFCQPIYFFNRPESTKVKIEFDGQDFTVCDE